MNLNNKTILITGGTGTFGQVMVKSLLKIRGIKKIIIYSRDEFKQQQMRKKIDSKILRYFIGDIRDKSRLTIATIGVDLIIHAAALKHVDVAEYNPTEFVETNIFGAKNLIEVCSQNKIKKVVALSTDKASSPINLYGATKLASDKLFVSANMLGGKKNSCRFSVVRYGNVLNSRGSVIPLFKSLLLSKKPLTITDLNMTRFFISLDDGIKFVLESFLRMKGGEIFIPKLPSCYIKDLAKALDPKVKFKVIGIRPGEKLHESLCSAEESHLILEFKDHYVVEPTIWEKNIHVQTFMINKRREKGTKVKKGFEYNSLNNPDMINIKSIQKILKKVD